MFFPNPEVPHEMKVIYMGRRKTDLVACERAIADQDFAFLQKIGHQVKGSAVSYGFDALAPIALALETAAELKDIPQLKVLVKDLNAAVKILEESLLTEISR